MTPDHDNDGNHSGSQGQQPQGDGENLLHLNGHEVLTSFVFLA